MGDMEQRRNKFRMSGVRIESNGLRGSVFFFFFKVVKGQNVYKYTMREAVRAACSAWLTGFC